MLPTFIPGNVIFKTKTHKRRKGSLFACCFYICLEMLMSYGAVKVFTTSSAGGGLSQKSSRAQPTWYFAGGVLSPLVGGIGGSAPSILFFFTSILFLTHQGKFFSTALRPSRERAPPGECTRNPRLRFPWGPQVVTVPWTRQPRRAPGASRGRSSARRCLWSVLPALRSSAALR